MFRSPSISSRLGPERTDRLALTRLQCWLLALTLPAILGPAWSYALGATPALLGSLTSLILVLLLGVSTMTDLSQKKIYNWATYSALGWAVAINAVAESTGVGVIGLQDSLFGAAVCGGFVLVAYTLARGGAGDVKLATAIGVLLGVDQGLLAVSASYMLAGAAILLWTAWTIGCWAFLKTLCRKMGAVIFPRWISPPYQENQAVLKAPIPLAPYFACGTLTIVIWF